jgi:hypothetical protein
MLTQELQRARTSDTLNVSNQPTWGAKKS